MGIARLCSAPSDHEQVNVEKAIKIMHSFFLIWLLITNQLDGITLSVDDFQTIQSNLKIR
jgi:hypothetical protein